jgi:hypothetical protein
MALLSADNHGQDLARMGVLTGLAVGLHNVVSHYPPRLRTGLVCSFL